MTSALQSINRTDRQEYLRIEGERLIADAKAVEIADEASNDDAADFAKSINRSIAEVEAEYEEPIKTQRAALQVLYDQKNAHIAPRTEALKIIKGKLAAFHQLLVAQAAEQRRKLEEAARRVEEECRAEEFDAAVEAGDIVAANEIVERPVFVPAPVISVAKVKGVGFREKWCFEFTSLQAVVEHCAKHPEDTIALLCGNQTGTRQLVNARKQAFNVPGIKVWPESNVATSRR